MAEEWKIPNVKAFENLNEEEQKKHTVELAYRSFTEHDGTAHPNRLVILDDGLRDQAFSDELNRWAGQHTQVMLGRINHLRSLPLNRRGKSTDYPVIRWNDRKPFYKRWKNWLMARIRQCRKWIRSHLPARVVVTETRPEADQSYYTNYPERDKKGV